MKILSALVLAVAAAAQSPQLLLDGNPAPGVSSTPTSFGRGPIDGTVTLVLDDGVHGHELWLSDGTSNGTSRLTDFAAPVIFRSVETMADLTVFVVERGTSLELWRTDGTSAGTTLLHTGSVSSGMLYPNAPVAHGEVLFFADAGTTWRTDGTVAGTFSLGVPSASWLAPLPGATSPGATLLYGLQGQLIVSDGYTANVVGSAPNGLLLTPDWGMFQTDVQFAPGGITLTMTALHLPGTPTLQVPFPSQALPIPGRALLVATATGLLRWDGTAPPQLLLPWSMPDSRRLRQGARWVFVADVPGVGMEPVISDGTPAGTVVVDVEPGPAGSAPVLAVALRDRVVLWADTGGLGSEPHVTDGTPTGTMRLGDLEPGAGGSSFGGYTPVGERRAVLAVQTSALGKEPWLTDGTPGGTALLADIRPGAGASLITPAGFVVNVGVLAGDKLVFVADDGVHGREPWVVALPGVREEVQRYSARRFDCGDPVLGAAMPLRASGLPAFDVGVVAIGPPLAGCLPLAPRRCVHFDPSPAVVAGVVFAGATGEWSGAVALPNQPAAIGIDLVAQALFVDAAQPLGIEVGDAHWLSPGF